jgi:hypothetical protein
MDILYTSTGIPDHIKGGLIMFNLHDRVMSRIKSKVWKTLSHVGILYQSLVSGKPKTWVIYMDEIYGIISCPLEEFIFIDSLKAPSQNRPWAIRYIENFDSSVSTALNKAVGLHSHEDSNLGLDENNRITGSFDDELRSILGVPRKSQAEGNGEATNTNLGFAFDILSDFWKLMRVSEDQLVRETSVGFSEDEIIEDDLLRSFYNGNVGGGDELMKTVNRLLSMVNLTTHTINPPIQPLLTKPLPLFTNFMVVPTDVFYREEGRKVNHFTYPHIAEERQHVATVIASMFESGIGTDGVREYFEEEIETTILARRGRGELTAELARDYILTVLKYIEKTRGALENAKSKVDRETHNGHLYDLIVSQGTLMTHLGIEDIRIPIDRLKL